MAQRDPLSLFLSLHLHLDLLLTLLAITAGVLGIETARWNPGSAQRTCPDVAYEDLTGVSAHAFWADCLRISNWTTDNFGTYTWDSGADSGAGGAGLGRWTLIRKEGSCALLMRYDGHLNNSAPTAATATAGSDYDSAGVGWEESDGDGGKTNTVATIGNQDISDLVWKAVNAFATRFGDVVEVWGNLTCDQNRRPPPAPQSTNYAVVNWWLRNASSLEVLNGEDVPPDPLPPEVTTTTTTTATKVKEWEFADGLYWKRGERKGRPGGVVFEGWKRADKRAVGGEGGGEGRGGSARVG
ncbi:hypothetical protein AAE478_004327 [Parahypoxylon ruwenzoriense]